MADRSAAAKVVTSEVACALCVDASSSSVGSDAQLLQLQKNLHGGSAKSSMGVEVPVLDLSFEEGST